MDLSERFVKNEYSVYSRLMPKVTDQHREDRRDQILVAAWKCFSRNGFHSTSMADVIREAGLSAGAVYLYFRSKDEIIVAVGSQVFSGIRGRLTEFAAREPTPSPAEIAGYLVRQPVFAQEQAPADLYPLLLAVWGEATRNPALTALAGEIFGDLHRIITGMLERWQEAGNTPVLPPAALAPILLSLVQGFVVQQALVHRPAADDYSAAVETLFTAAGLGD